jgi:Icc-related predicted phosphoesterase
MLPNPATLRRSFAITPPGGRQAVGAIARAGARPLAPTVSPSPVSVHRAEWYTWARKAVPLERVRAEARAMSAIPPASGGTCFFVSDVHGSLERYDKLLAAARRERPRAIFLGGDLLPHRMSAAAARSGRGFLDGVLVPRFAELRDALGEAYPSVLAILGNDDPRAELRHFETDAARAVITYVGDRREPLADRDVYGYSYCPPSPFLLKDWERYDVSRFVDPGCVPPDEGWRSVDVSPDLVAHRTIADDLDDLFGTADVADAVALFHCPPYRSNLDRAALDGRMVDHAPLDVHIGSIAIRRFIERRQPLVTLHGHVHESARITGQWRDRIGRTHAFSAAHDGPELALVRFDFADLDAATRELL